MSWLWRYTYLVDTHTHVGIRTWLWRYTSLLLLISMLWHRQAIFESKGYKLFSSECRIRTQGLWNRTSCRQNARWQTDRAIEDQAKDLNSTARPYDQRAFSPLDPLPVGIRTWLWRYTCLLLLISMLWHKQAIFKSKGDKLSSSAECWIRTQRVSGPESPVFWEVWEVWDTKSPADWMPTHKPTELFSEDQTRNFNSIARP